MSQQFQLSFDKPRSRKTDPASSKRAADSMQRSGALRGQRLICLELVKKYPGKSSKEIAKLAGVDRYMLARRLPELEEMKHVRRTEIGSNDCQWWPL